MSGAVSDPSTAVSAADAALHEADKASAGRVNISRWALEHAALTRYLLIRQIHRPVAHFLAWRRGQP